MDVQVIVDQYIRLCSQLCQKPSDYTKENVRKHNKAMRELLRLTDKIKRSPEIMGAVFSVLLNQSDAYVRQNAATTCLNMGIHTAKAVGILEQISKSKDRMAAMGAQRTLRIWKGELDANSPGH